MEFINRELFGGKSGVYLIRCKERVYVGSTCMTFSKRYIHHRSMLNKGTHKNLIMQRCHNKYSKDSFTFEVLEVVSDNILEREQYWIDTFNSFDVLTNGMNINPKATGGNQFSLETIAKRSKSIKEFWVNNGTDKLKGRTPWNKGVQASEEIKTKLRKPKRLKEDHHYKRKIATRNRAKNVAVYFEDKLIGIWSSARYLDEWSQSNIIEHIKPNSCNVVWRGIQYHVLQYVNIIKACRENKPYKSLTLKYTDTAPTFCEEF